MANIFGRQVVVSLTNKSGGSVIAGDVVIVDTGNDEAFTTTTSAAAITAIGIAQETIPNNASGRVLTAGYAALVNVNASVTRGNFGATHTVAKQAADAGASRVLGTFCRFLKGGTSPSAHVYPVDLAGAALTNPMTTAEDIIKGGASGTPARLAVGAAGGALSSLNAAVAYNSGTSFPGSKVTGDRYWRTDLGLEAYWDGTRWLTTTLFSWTWGVGDSLLPASGNLSLGRNSAWTGDYDLWLVKFYALTYVATTNTGSAYWTVSCDRVVGASAASFNTSADTHDVYTNHSAAIGALIGATEKGITLNLAKTSTPGGIYVGAHLTYRLVLT